jgi:alcohol dehydrogenase
VRELPEPAVGPKDVLVEVKAASVNPVDFKIRDGKLAQILDLKFPLILGNDLSGVVKQVGSAVTRFKAGDEVWARLEKNRGGAWAERCALDESVVSKKPSKLSFVEAASLPLVGLTAWQALELMELKAGQRLLVHAGAGGVGTVAIQLAKARGATVLATASAKNHKLLTDLGCDVPIDYSTTKFEDVAKGCDAVFDTMGGDTLTRSLAMVKEGGAVVSVAGLPDEPTAQELGLALPVRLILRFLTRKVCAAAAARKVRYRYLFMHPSGAELEQLGALVEAGKLKALVEKTFPLEQAQGAVEAVESGRTRGKIVLTVS